MIFFILQNIIKVVLTFVCTFYNYVANYANILNIFLITGLSLKDLEHHYW